MIKFNFWIGLLGLLVFATCDIINSEEKIPAYLHISEFEIVDNPAIIHGSLSHKITNARVFITVPNATKTTSLGTVSLPATVPVLASGEVLVTLDPVVKANGSSFSLEIYPFYKRVETNAVLEASAIDTIVPVTKYEGDLKFRFIEDFEEPNSQQIFTDDRDGNPNTFLEVSAEDVFEGAKSGRAVLTVDNPNLIVATPPITALNFRDVKQAFLEIDYKTDVQLEFGLVGIDGVGQEFAGFNFIILPKNDWNKIYLDITEELRVSDFDTYRVAFRAQLPTENGNFTLDKGTIYLDNIKLVHF